MNFPPKDWTDIVAYPDDDVTAGYTESRPGDPEPGANRPPGYRWGWVNRQRDRAGGADDGFDQIRRDYFRHMTPAGRPKSLQSKRAKL